MLLLPEQAKIIESKKKALSILMIHLVNAENGPS